MGERHDSNGSPFPREEARASPSLTIEMVGELTRLGRLINVENIGHAIRDLRAALITWAQTIRQYPYLCGAFWDALEAVQKHGVWSNQQIESARPDREAFAVELAAAVVKAALL